MTAHTYGDTLRHREVLGRQFITSAKRHWKGFCIADSFTAPLTYGRVLVASLLLSRWIRRHAPGQARIGLLLPASVGGALANIATAIAGKAAFKEKFGITLLEGYGCTEMSPVVAVNAPDVQDEGEHQRGSLSGSVGHPLPGVVAKVVDAETGEGPLIGKDGLLLVNGPNRMQGYLGEPERTAEVLRDGWYVTGDIACIDESGFIRITDRLSRFSKIAGEMVPHMKVEEQIQALIDAQYNCVVTAVPDDARGERLVAFYTDPLVRPHELWERLCRTELPRLWLPKREDLRFVDAIPTLGTGKVDLRAVRQLAAGAGAAEAVAS